MQQHDIDGTSERRRRNHRRFSLQYPVRITFRSGESVAEFDAVSENVGCGGILLKSPWMIPLHTSVSLAMSIQGDHVVRPLRLVAEGETVRLGNNSADATYLIAVQFAQAVTEIEAHIDYVLLRPRRAERRSAQSAIRKQGFSSAWPQAT